MTVSCAENMFMIDWQEDEKNLLERIIPEYRTQLPRTTLEALFQHIKNVEKKNETSEIDLKRVQRLLTMGLINLQELNIKNKDLNHQFKIIKQIFDEFISKISPLGGEIINELIDKFSLKFYKKLPQ